LKGFQNRYILIVDKKAKLNVPEIDFNKIDEVGAGMYKGEKIKLSERNRAQQ